MLLIVEWPRLLKMLLQLDFLSYIYWKKRRFKFYFFRKIREL